MRSYFVRLLNPLLATSTEYNLAQKLRILNPLRTLITLLFAFMLGACSSSNDAPVFTETVNMPEPLPEYDFSSIDTAMQTYLDESEVHGSISYTIVDLEQGTVHEEVFGEHTADRALSLLSASRMLAALLLVALHDDPDLDFDLTQPIENYLPWDGVYGDATTVQLLSHTSGIPGSRAAASYGEHLCHFVAQPDLLTCAEAIYTTELPDSIDPGMQMRLGGSQWHLVAAVAETVGGASWQQLYDQYIAAPCELEVVRFGQPGVGEQPRWDGNPDNLAGLSNPNLDYGAITHLRDYAKLLSLRLSGSCGDNQILSSEALALMQQDHVGPEVLNFDPLGVLERMGYGLGEWTMPVQDNGDPTVFLAAGAGNVGWVDIDRGYGGFVTPDVPENFDTLYMVRDTWIALIAQQIDEARAAVSQ